MKKSNTHLFRLLTAFISFKTYRFEEPNSYILLDKQKILDFISFKFITLYCFGINSDPRRSSTSLFMLNFKTQVVLIFIIGPQLLHY